MGVILAPDNGDATSPDVSWSWTWFGHFRRALAVAEGIDLDSMVGFGGDRSWDTVETSLSPLLSHPGDEWELTAAECAQLLPRLSEVISRWHAAPSEDLQAYAERGQDLIEVVRVCIHQDVPLMVF
ncbi:hypothetical protein [Microtetraspora fusca]|uniref:Barstar (barnase inhibitor) domain-containing protein n=1 Tax=Microtetraspora fusca TaxID=1997 RepID=A0ABW6UYH4_MICFU|nr:hypothetical protein [Microtetraspora fusca]